METEDGVIIVGDDLTELLDYANDLIFGAEDDDTDEYIGRGFPTEEEEA